MASYESEMVDKLKKRFDAWELDIVPPPEGPRTGSARQTGGSGLVRYVFGSNERGDYLEYYSFHRIGGESHGRIYANGDFERLEAVETITIVSGEAEVDAQRREQLHARNRRVVAELEEAGLLSGGPVPNSFTINSAIVTGAVDPDTTSDED